MVLVRQFPVPTEGVKLQNPGVEAFVDNEDHGKGNLFVTESNIAWINGDSGEGFKIAYKNITLHAISRDPGVHSRACLYVMLNGNVLDEDENFEVECTPDLDDGEEETTEIRFVPDDDSLLDEMYKAVQECSLLHPDPSSDLSNDEEQEGIFEDYEGGDGDMDENAEGEEDVDEEELEEEEVEAERLEQFLRMQLHFQNRNGGGQDEDGHNNGSNGGDPDLSFVPAPGQFDDN